MVMFAAYSTHACAQCLSMQLLLGPGTRTLIGGNLKTGDAMQGKLEESSSCKHSLVFHFTGALTLIGGCGCARLNPTGNLYFDGTSLHPYDAMFIKMKKDLVQGRTTSTAQALRYQYWMDTAVSLLQQKAWSLAADVQRLSFAYIYPKFCPIH